MKKQYKWFALASIVGITIYVGAGITDSSTNNQQKNVESNVQPSILAGEENFHDEQTQPVEETTVPENTPQVAEPTQVVDENAQVKAHAQAKIDDYTAKGFPNMDYPCFNNFMQAAFQWQVTTDQVDEYLGKAYIQHKGTCAQYEHYMKTGQL